MEIRYIDIGDLRPAEYNPRKTTDHQKQEISDSLKRFGLVEPLVVNFHEGREGVIVGGHQRYYELLKQGVASVPVSVVNLDEDSEKELNIRLNKNIGGWDELKLEEYFTSDQLKDFGFLDSDFVDLKVFGEETQVVEDEAPEVSQEEPKSKLGEVYRLGRHRLMCGDSTKIEDVEKLMNGQKADMVFTDPPYGMKKENEGVLNDNLSYEDLLEFNKEWIPLSFAVLKDNGSWYCWGTDEPLMDIYSNILKPYIKENKATFRNLITWDKGNGQGQNSEETRMYATADEKCLFLMMGVQGFNTNKDNYYDGWEGIRSYLDGERMKMGWGVDDVIRITGKTSASHYFTKSQWTFPTKEHYESIQKEAGNEGFKKDYEEIKKDYEEIKKEYYSTRAYFDNTHDNMNNVWHNSRDVQNQDHATPKPLELCQRAIKSSSRENETVLDLFGGSGSTLIACEQLNRTCYMMELDEKYCDVIRKRYAKFIGKEDWELATPIVL